ncbi:MAG: type II secretion system protein GspL [Desulfobulbaceae bacterium]
MKRRVLGLDISDDFVAAVVVQQTGQDRRVIACAFHERGGGEDIADLLPGLLSGIGWSGGAAVCGISLAGVSVRNLSLPFTDRKKIEQVLPLEMDDQLLTPVAEQMVEYLVTGADENSSTLLVAALEKEALRLQLDALARGGLSPDTVTLRNMALAEMLARSGKMAASFMLIDAGVHAVNMALVHRGGVVFFRHLPYPERMYTEAPFAFSNGLASITHSPEALACISAICEDIRRSIGFLALESGMAVEPEQVVLTGSMLQVDELRAMISEELAREVIPCSLKQEAGITLTAELREEWQPALFDHALALALQGLKKRPGVNFRKDEFAPERRMLASKPRLIAAAAAVLLLLVGSGVFLGFDYRSLKKNHDELGRQMETLYKETFPGATKVVDPLTQMQANIQDIQAPAIATPVFSGDKRILNILADISGRIPKELTIHVTRMVIDQESVQLRGDTDTFNNVNLIQGNLRKSPLFDEVAIVSAAADKGSSMIRFELRLQTGRKT